MKLHIPSKNVLSIFSEQPSGYHYVQIYQNITFQTETAAQYIQESLLKNEGIVVIAGIALRKAVTAKMQALDLDISKFKSDGQIKFLDAEFLLSSFWVDGKINRNSFFQSVGIPIQALKLKYGKVHAMTEMSNFLWKQSLFDPAMQLEGLWHDLFRKQEFSLLCTYLVESLDPNTFEESLERICQYHSHFKPIERVDSLEPSTSDAIWNLFVEVWNRVISKIENSSQISSHIPPAK